MKKIKPVEFIIAIVLPLLVGSIASYLTSNAMTAFNAMKKPDLAPPGILFPIVAVVPMYLAVLYLI